jgi:hypothetical protein
LGLLQTLLGEGRPKAIGPRTQAASQFRPPAYNLHMGDYYAGFVEGEGKERETTVQAIRDWQPPKYVRTRRR